jgi:hypothetical protein
VRVVVGRLMPEQQHPSSFVDHNHPEPAGESSTTHFVSSSLRHSAIYQQRHLGATGSSGRNRGLRVLVIPFEMV